MNQVGPHSLSSPDALPPQKTDEKKSPSGSIRESSGEAHSINVLQHNSPAGAGAIPIANAATKALCPSTDQKQPTLEEHTLAPANGSSHADKPDQVALSTLQGSTPKETSTDVDDLLASLDVADPTDVDTMIASLDITNVTVDHLISTTPKEDSRISFVHNLDELDEILSQPFNLDCINFDETGKATQAELNPTTIQNAKAILNKATGEIIYRGTPNQVQVDALHSFSKTYCLQNNLPMPKTAIKTVSEENWQLVANKYTAAFQKLNENNVNKKEVGSKHTERKEQLKEPHQNTIRHADEKRPEKKITQSTDDAKKAEIRSMESRQEITNLENNARERDSKRRKTQHHQKVETIERKHEEKVRENRNEDIKHSA